MLSFFRKIRNRLIATGSTKKYLVYSLGEIVLVVIGILIALQINKWNENRVDRTYEKEYLERLVVDIQRDSSLIQFIKGGLEHKKIYLIEVRAKLEDDTTILDDSLEHVLYESRYFGTDLPSERLVATYTEILSSGHLRLIRNIDLRNSISAYYKIWDHTYHRVSNRASDYTSLVVKIVDEEGVFANVPVYKEMTLRQVLKTNGIETEFRLNLVKEANYLEFTKRRIKELEALVEDVKTMIQEELKKID